MPYRSVSLNAEVANHLRAGLSVARVRWQQFKDAGDPEPWAAYSAESMRLSAELYHSTEDAPVELLVSRESAGCINAAAKTCMVSPDPMVAKLAETLSTVASVVRTSFSSAV